MVCHLLDIVQCARLSDATPTRLIHITVRWAEKKTFEQIWTNVNYEMGHQETMKLRSHDIRGLSEWHNKHMHSNEHGEHLLFIVVLFSSIVIDDAHYNCNNRHYTRQIAEQIENIRILSTKKNKKPRLIASWINVFLIRWESIITSRIWRPRLFNEHSNACRREPILSIVYAFCSIGNVNRCLPNAWVEL